MNIPLKNVINGILFIPLKKTPPTSTFSPINLFMGVSLLIHIQ